MHLFSFDVETVKRMIDYLYTGQFNGDLKSEEVDSATTIEAGDSSFSQDGRHLFNIIYELFS